MLLTLAVWLIFKSSSDVSPNQPLPGVLVIDNIHIAGGQYRACIQPSNKTSTAERPRGRSAAKALCTSTHGNVLAFWEKNVLI